MSNRPIIAATVYHNADGIWKTPLWLMETLPDYRFLFRSQCLVRHRRRALRDTERKARVSMARYAKNSRLIFDLGMNNGDDTAYYLSRGYKVVAIEANPVLCDRAREQVSHGNRRWPPENPQCRNLGTTDQTTFYINLDNDHWSSLDAAGPAVTPAEYKAITVPCITLSNCSSEFGVPYYLKIDVEGVDQTVLEQLHTRVACPNLCQRRRLPLRL